MSLKKELIKTFQNLLGVYFGKVYSDSELKVSSMEVGSKVESINADGTLSDVEDGDYVMENGTAFTTKDSMIVSIEGQEPVAPVEAEVEVTVEDESIEPIVEDEVPASGTTEVEVIEPVEEEDMEDEMEARVKTLEDTIASLVEKVAAMEAKEAETLSAITKFNSEVETLNSNIKTLAKVPVQFTKTNNKNIVNDNKEEKMLDLARILGGVTKK
jgi:hypothetical protein